MEPIWITGAGIVSALGVGMQETLTSLLHSRTGIGEMRHLKTEHREFPVGEVHLSNEEMAMRLHIAPHLPTTRTALMGMMALEEALHDSGLEKDGVSDVGLISGTTVGGMDKSEQYYLDFLSNNSRNEYIKTHDCGACTEMIADRFGTFAFLTSVSTACSSAANAVVLGANAIRNGDAECVVVGGSECITKFHLNGFNSLMILDRQLCRPFDAQRAGLNLGEGAAFLVLETPSHAMRRGARPQALLSGYGNACDAYHQTASSPEGEGAFLAMKAPLEMAGLQPCQIDYINAHGTGTPNNDASESEAVHRLWGSLSPRISSTKAFTGHTTSASGSIELAICLLAMKYRFIPANLHFSQPDEACLIPVTETMTGITLRHVLCNSFGFGGNDTSVIVSQPLDEKSPDIKGGPDIQPLPATPVYILSSEQVSAQSALDEGWISSPNPLGEAYCRSVTPDFKQFIPPMEARRMGNILKRAIVTSQAAVDASGVGTVDAIVTGTGLGCVESTELFLKHLCHEGEQMLKPTHFMQSTHNTIGSLVGIRMKCHGYNVTYAHKEISFDSALYDAWLQLKSGNAHKVLVGGHDELTPSYFELLAKIGFLGLPGQSAGETAVSFVLADNPHCGRHPLCRLEGVKLSYHPDVKTLETQLHSLLRGAGITLEDIDGVMVGTNGNPDHDSRCLQHYRQLFGNIPRLEYKHLFGDSYTASGLGLYVAVCCMSHKTIPPILFATPRPSQPLADPHAILLYNPTDGGCHTITLITN